ncbi:hypothetical protein MSPP1_003465 [Malassezia sp. CBS 17886]|nr:hypothetical protein MSPP1_003465 [Malassezia sp. CBS 17886]
MADADGARGPGALSVKSRAIVCADADLRGEVTIGTVVNATRAPVVVGNNCIIEERATLIGSGDGLIIGDGNVFEIACRVEAVGMGNCNTVGARAVVAPGVRISNFCTVGAGMTVAVRIAAPETLPERTTTFADGQRRLWSGEGVGQQLALHAKHLQYLRDELPKTHKLYVVR